MVPIPSQYLGYLSPTRLRPHWPTFWWKCGKSKPSSRLQQRKLFLAKQRNRAEKNTHDSLDSMSNATFTNELRSKMFCLTERNHNKSYLSILNDVAKFETEFLSFHTVQIKDGNTNCWLERLFSFARVGRRAWSQPGEVGKQLEGSCFATPSTIGLGSRPAEKIQRLTQRASRQTLRGDRWVRLPGCLCLLLALELQAANNSVSGSGVGPFTFVFRASTVIGSYMSR